MHSAYSVEHSSLESKHRRFLAFVRSLVAEFIGTFFLTFAHAVASLIIRTLPGPTNFVSINGAAISNGATLVLLISALSKVSGAHFNPAISFGFFLRRAISLVRLLSYWVFQVGGSVCAGLIIWLIFGKDGELGSNAPEHISDWKAFGLETILSFLLVFVVLSTSQKGAIVVESALAVGSALLVLTFLGGSYGGGSMNPARSFGVGIFSDANRSELWIYVAAAFCGAVGAAIITRLLTTTKGDANVKLENAAQGTGGLES